MKKNLKIRTKQDEIRRLIAKCSLSSRLVSGGHRQLGDDRNALRLRKALQELGDLRRQQSQLPWGGEHD
jgi:hypothetical protein